MARILLLGLILWITVDTAFAAPPDRQLYYNQDSTQFFTSEIAVGQAGEMIDRYVDGIADAGVTVFFCNTNARRTNYRSGVWDAFWDGYDPSGPDDQPFLAPVPSAQVASYRKVIHNMWKVQQEGVDYPARVLARCRLRKMAAWISLRMNDCHDNDIPNHPFHGSFWVENPQLRRQNCTGYFATCLDFAQPKVREYYRALIDESLDRYDMDGLELDFMREPYVFSANKEVEGKLVLTQWLRDIRQRVDQAASKRGHPIHLGVRVPSRPETALGMGLDAGTWAREGLIDLLVVTPRWATLEFGMAIPEWRQQLGKANLTLVGGLEVLYRPIPSGPAEYISPELAHGAASLVLADGADAVYLFNYFPETMPKRVYCDTLRAMTSLSALQAVPRTIGVTYRDVIAPNETYIAPLPAKGKEATFSMKIGPQPPVGWHRELVIGLDVSERTSTSRPQVFLDGNACDFKEEKEGTNGHQVMKFKIPVQPWDASQTHEIKIASADDTILVIERVELVMKP